MATANTWPRSRRAPARRGPWLTAALLLVLAGAMIAWLYGETIAGYAQAGTAYGAKNACSCRHLAGRELGSCKTDFLPGMEMVFLSEDEEERSVTAYVPLIASNTARFAEGFGCVLDPWES